MSNQDGQRADLRRASRLNERGSKEAVDWGLLRSLNERGLELMVELARSELAHAPPAVSSNRALWSSLDTPARERAANCQLLLLDINFTDVAWWRRVAEHRPLEPNSRSESYLSVEVALELMRETLTLAWIVAREDPAQATVFCGMAPPVASLFASFSLSDLDRLCAQYHRHLRLRFDDQPSYWRKHLRIVGSKLVNGGQEQELAGESRQQSLF